MYLKMHACLQGWAKRHPWLPTLCSGVAPNAKLSFFDLLDGDGPNIVTPGDCFTDDEDDEDEEECVKGSIASLFELHYQDVSLSGCVAALSHFMP